MPGAAVRAVEKTSTLLIDHKFVDGDRKFDSIRCHIDGDPRVVQHIQKS